MKLNARRTGVIISASPEVRRWFTSFPFQKYNIDIFEVEDNVDKLASKIDHIRPDVLIMDTKTSCVSLQNYVFGLNLRKLTFKVDGEMSPRELERFLRNFVKRIGISLSKEPQRRTLPAPSARVQPQRAVQTPVPSRPARAPQASVGKQQAPAPKKGPGVDVIAIGASTGGTEAIREIIVKLPPNFPGLVITQHMPAGFTQMFAERLNQLCRNVEVKEAQSGDVIAPGKVFIAPGDFHMKVIPGPHGYQIVCEKGEKISGHRPSVDVLFNSVAKHIGNRAVGVLLTGMGSDGAHGLFAMRKAGAKTAAQDKESSIVFGMPKVAWEIGAAERLVPLKDVALFLTSLVHGRRTQ